MTVVQTVLVYLVIPAAALAVLAILVFAPSGGRSPRYRPSRGWTYEPVWYLPRPSAVEHPGGAGPVARAALTSGAPRQATARGGASGSW